MKFGRKDTPKNVVDHVGIVTRAPRLCGIEDGGLDATLVVLAEDTGGVTYQPGREGRERERIGGRISEKRGRKERGKGWGEEWGMMGGGGQ